MNWRARSGDAASAIEADREVRLSDINDQAQRFVHVTIGCLGATWLLLIWNESVPAFGLLLPRYPLWPNSVTARRAGGDARLGHFGDLLLALIVVALTAVSCRTIPGAVRHYAATGTSSGCRHALRGECADARTYW